MSPVITSGIKIQILENKIIEVSGSAFSFQVNFCDLTHLYIDHAKNALDGEGNIKIEKDTSDHPKPKDNLGIVLQTATSKFCFTIDRLEGEKLALLTNDHFKAIILSADPANLTAEHEELIEDLRSEIDGEEISYPVTFSHCRTRKY